jgi:predicted DNA binding protein
MHEVVDRAGEGVLAVGEDWRVSDANRRARELLETDPVGASIDDLLPGGIATRLREVRASPARCGPAAVEERDGPAEGGGALRGEAEFFPTQERWLEVRADLAGEPGFVYLYDVTEWVRREQELGRRRDELQLLSRLNSLVQDLVAALVGATTREEIEDAIVEQLAATDVFALAWIATWGSDEGLEVAAVASDHTDLVDHLAAPDTPSPERAVLRTGNGAVIPEVANSENVPASVRRDAFAHGIQSAAAVPIGYGDTVFGALGVYAVRPGALAEPGLMGLETLGEVGGFAINATRNRQTLRSATSRELELGFESPDSVLADLATGSGRTIAVEGTAQPAVDRLLCYVSVTAEDTDAVVAAATDHEHTDRVRQVGERDGGVLLELGLGEASPLVTLVDHGGTIQAATAADGTLTVVVQVSPATEVRDLVDALAVDCPSVALLAKRTTEAVAGDVADLSSVFADELTDRQRVALRTAYRGGYFESPRESTAEELAESIGVSSPTFHHHLRAAHRKLFDELFADQH